MEQDRAEDDHEYRRRELQDDGVRRGGQFVGNREQGCHADEGKGAEKHLSAEHDPVPADQHIDPDQQRPEQVPGAVDRQGGPGDQLYEKPSCTEGH